MSEGDRIRVGPPTLGTMVAGQTAGSTAPRAGAEWGLASVLLGGLLALLVPPALQIAHTLELTGYRGFSTQDKRLAGYGGYIAAGLCMALAIVGVGFGIKGINLSRQHGQAAALGITGVLVGVLAFLFWVGAMIAWHSQAWGRLV